MPRKLTRMKVDEISLVERGANPGARVLIFKGDGMSEADKEQREIAKRAAASICEAMVAKAREIIVPALNSKNADTINGALDDFEDAAAAIITAASGEAAVAIKAEKVASTDDLATTLAKLKKLMGKDDTVT